MSGIPREYWPEIAAEWQRVSPESNVVGLEGMRAIKRAVAGEFGLEIEWMAKEVQQNMIDRWAAGHWTGDDDRLLDKAIELAVLQ